MTARETKPTSSMQSLWSQTTALPARETLKGDISTDALVIGAGMAGVLIADRLRQHGVQTVVLEADRVGGGQTRNTTAKITSQHGMCYDALIRSLGHERARQYAQANQEAIEEYARIISERKINCGFRRAPAYLYAQTSDAPLRCEAQAAAGLGLPAQFVPQAELPFPTAGAVLFTDQACFHPLGFLKALSEGLDIYENTPVVCVEGKTARTPHGSVCAEHIVFATHYPFVNVPGWYFMRMHQERSYVLALESDFKPEGLYYGTDPDGLSLREAEGLLLVGGENHRTGENSTGGRYRALEQRARALLRDCPVAARWSAQDCITLDGVPYIGQFAASTPHWYVATGFGKWGMSASMAAAMLIAGQITGKAPEWGEVFSPERLHLSASAKSLATETAQAFKGLARMGFAIPRETLESLANGHGGIVETPGGAAGVYKDDAGECHIVNPRCPHLGCRLEWNPDERSWDCPCHGSRFDCDGALLDNPAQVGLT